jgi:hypothetical protein
MRRSLHRQLVVTPCETPPPGVGWAPGAAPDVSDGFDPDVYDARSPYFHWVW